MKTNVTLLFVSVLCSLLMTTKSAAQQKPAIQPATSQPASHWSVTDSGALPDGITDNTAAFQKALDQAGRAGGGIVDVPAGRFRINGTLTIPAGVTLQGTYRVPPTATGRDAKPDGTTLLAYAGRGAPNSAPFIKLAGQNASLAGVVVLYPEWKQSDVPPVAYPPCVESVETNSVAIQDCCFLNPYEAIRLIRAHRHLIRNVTGYPSKRGLYVDECYDIGHVENVHFWPFGVAYNPDDPYCKWVNTEGVAFEFARTDWHYVFNTFCFGYGVGYKFSESKSGATNGNFLGLGADSCRRAILVEQAQPYGLLITNGEFVGRWGSTDSVTIEIGPKAAGKVSLVNCSFWGPIDRCIWMRSTAGQLTADACHFVSWDNHNQGSPAIQLDAGKAIVQACTFAQVGVDVRVASPVRSAILNANQADGGFQVENLAGGRMQSVANELGVLDTKPQAKLHYRVVIGADGDGAFLSGFHGRERSGSGAAAQPMRWSADHGRLILPVVADRSYEATIECRVPKQAVAPDAGLYLAGRRVAEITAATTTLTVSLSPTNQGAVSLELRCRGWVPKEIEPGSQDSRTLGISVLAVEMQARGAERPLFNANSGD